MMRSALLLLAAAAAGHDAQPTTFKVQTELVRVLVERNGRPVAGLAASDFVVEDNGVPQRIDLLPASDAVTASAVLDVSGSMTPEKLNAAAAGVRSLMAALRGPDRHALYAFAGDVRRIVLPEPHETLSAGTIADALREASGPRTSLSDALFAAILEDDAGPGPRMLAVLTDGRDNTSWLYARAVVEAALRHETVIYAVAVGQDSSAARLGVPPMLADDGRRLLQVLADRTGGRLIDAAWSSDLASIFASIISEYRQRYIITFVPTGVAKRDGWHRLTVKLRNRPGRIRARSGYWSR
jgi:VWFA-related protein